MMDALVTPDLEMLRDWMDKTTIDWFECGSCQALHLSAMQNIDGVFDAKLDIIDNVILVTVSAEVRSSALLTLVGEISQINASSLTAKCFLDIQDDSLPRLIICQSLSIGYGLALPQFSFFMQQSEEQLSMIIMELAANHLLVTSENTASPHTVQPLLH
ncbi:putative sensory transduction regulator [Tatumella ptyseos ATCC 33301]|uniref:Bacterial sensory transduction regulator n=3 Tax=Erwiniaceae TaxID=1903409 RepID=A0A2X5NLX8_9GAMM|nr:putative sensory transduction regulator [Tatumella ptyseos ATCC 33301]SQK74086.1 Putative bacterial sensory transduction regulator [Tatumella ptyseos]